MMEVLRDEMHRTMRPRRGERYLRQIPLGGPLKLCLCTRVELPRGEDYSVVHSVVLGDGEPEGGCVRGSAG